MLVSFYSVEFNGDLRAEQFAEQYIRDVAGLIEDRVSLRYFGLTRYAISTERVYAVYPSKYPGFCIIKDGNMNITVFGSVDELTNKLNKGVVVKPYNVRGA